MLLSLCDFVIALTTSYNHQPAELNEETELLTSASLFVPTVIATLLHPTQPFFGFFCCIFGASRHMFFHPPTCLSYFPPV